MDADEDDFVFYGTPIQREDDLTSRKKKSVAEAAGQLRTLVPWKQEVRDEEGRRRFHGAFTGGYSLVITNWNVIHGALENSVVLIMVLIRVRVRVLKGAIGLNMNWV